MKKQLLSFIFLLLLMTQAKGQYIIAGQHGAKDYYAAPDTTVQPPDCYNDAIPEDSASYLIDMNGDGIMDFKLNSYCVFDLAYQVSWNEIYSLHNNEIVFGHNDTCAGPMAHAFNDSDTINNNRIWVDSSLSISFSAYIFPSYNCSDNIFYNPVDSIFSDSASGYLGARVFLAQDTLYGWIKIITGYNYTTIVSYACNLGVTGINEYQNNYTIKLYPNPATNQLTIQTSLHANEAVTVSIINVMGQTTSPPAPLHLERGKL